MEIAKEIPANIYISHFKARLYYEGLKNRCFFCKQEGHLKAECPKMRSMKVSAKPGSYSGIVAGAVANNLTKPSEDTSKLNMTPLQSRDNGTASKMNDQSVTQPESSTGTARNTPKKSSSESTQQEKPNGNERMDINNTLSSTETSQDDGDSPSKVSPRRGRSRSKKQNVERRMEQLLS